MRRPRLLGVTLLFLVGCSLTDAPPPDPDRFINVAVLTGAEQVGLPDSPLSDPITVRLHSRATDKPVADRAVHFRAPAGSGITITPSVGSTDSAGIVRAQVRLGSTLGRHTVEIDFTGNPGRPTAITLEAALTPIISQLSPSSTTADGVIVITGQNLGPQPELNEVMIDGSRARVTSATTTRLQARVPLCIPTRATNVVIRRGSLVSAPAPLAVTGVAGAALTLAPGNAITLAGAAELSCLRIGPQSADAAYLVITQNAAQDGTAKVPIRLVGLRHGGEALAQQSMARDQSIVLGTMAQPNAQQRWDVTLRQREAQLLARPRPRTDGTASAEAPRAALHMRIPEIGEQRHFRVFIPLKPAGTVNAVAVALGRHVAIYEDVEAAGSIPAAELETLVRSFDDPIYETDVAVFGEPSDLDRNQRVVVLLTPGVNRLTKVGETSFITGYFHGCDLLEVNQCPDTNAGEILYSVVPDPTGRFGLKHPTERIVKLLPPLIAHELQHLIHFNQRYLRGGQQTAEALWLMEGLAHFAEDTVGAVLRSRGMTTQADDFARENLVRAAFFLAKPHTTSLISSTGDGSLEERGAAWLFLKHLTHRLGGQVLRGLQTTQESGAANVGRTTGLGWATLLRDWGLALYASGAPDLNGTMLPGEQTFGAFDLRAALRTIGSQTFPLQPTQFATGDFAVDWAFPPSSASYVQLTAPAGSGINMILAGERGGDFKPDARPQMVILRIR